MKRFILAAATAGLIFFGGQADVEASGVEKLDNFGVETQELSKWTHFRDKHLRGHETENERRDRKEWERRHRDDRRYRDDYRHHYPPPPPPPKRGSRYGPPPPPPPPPPKHGSRHNPPPPPPRYR